MRCGQRPHEPSLTADSSEIITVLRSAKLRRISPSKSANPARKSSIGVLLPPLIVEITGVHRWPVLQLEPLKGRFLASLGSNLS